jgi:transposase-like protein
MSAPKGLSLPAITQRIPDEASAYKFLEELRWGDNPVCPHCGVVGGHYFLTPKNGGRKTRTGKVTQRRLWKCGACRRQFTVLVGTIFHRTKVPVRTWVLVLADMVSAKNGISAREIERKYGTTPRTAWFMAHRLREAMRAPEFRDKFTGTVIADETWIGGEPRNRAKGDPRRFGPSTKTPVLSLVNHQSGEVRSRVVPNVRRDTLRAAIREQVDLANTALHTDNAPVYTRIGWQAASHETVNHIAHEYVRGNVTTNHAEGFFAQLKRSIDGTHHHVSVEHLDRYLAEFDFRYSTRRMTDGQRMVTLLGRANRRLTYFPSGSGSSLVA